MENGRFRSSSLSKDPMTASTWSTQTPSPRLASSPLQTQSAQYHYILRCENASARKPIKPCTFNLRILEFLEKILELATHKAGK